MMITGIMQFKQSAYSTLTTKCSLLVLLPSAAPISNAAINYRIVYDTVTRDASVLGVESFSDDYWLIAS